MTYFAANFWLILSLSTGEFYYYSDRATFRSDPVGNRIEKHAIELDDYLIKYYNSVTPNALDAITHKYESADENASENQTELEFSVESSVSGTHTTDRKSLAPRMSMAATIKKAVTGKGIFQFKLVPLTGRELGLHYGLRADTEEDFDMWLEAMQSVSIAHFEESYYSEK